MSRGTLDTARSPSASPTGLSPSLAGLPRAVRLLPVALWRSEPRRARTTVWAVPVSLAATPGIEFSLFSSGYLDVSVHRVPSACLWIQHAVTEVCSAGFPHSDTHGSMDICSSPWLFAACRVFHRLLVPRHPPCALLCLTWPQLSPSVACCGFLPSGISSFRESSLILVLILRFSTLHLSMYPRCLVSSFSNDFCKRFLKILIFSIRFSRCKIDCSAIN